MTTIHDSATSHAPLSADERKLVVNQLERMLASPLFSQSKRYAPFLRHVVEKTLDGQEDALKERILGIELFRRTPNYDSNNDPVVRVTAGEVRKRIAQYYDDPLHRNEFRIDLPIGNYIAQFHPGPLSSGLAVDEEHRQAPLVAASLPEPIPGAVPEKHAHRKAKLRVAVAAIFIVIFSAGLVWWKFARRDSSAVDSVWANLVSSKSGSIVSMGEPRLYPPENQTEELSARQHLRSDYITLSDLQALLRVVKLLDRKDAVYRVQPASATSLADLGQGPAILLGGLDNPWTMRAEQNLRYRLQSDGKGVDWISDSRDPAARKWFVDFNRPYSAVTTDYAIVALFRDPGTQQPTLIIAGMGENGTKVASEFITEDAPLRSALGAPRQKPGGTNFEFVIGTEVVNGSTGAPIVLAKVIW